MPLFLSDTYKQIYDKSVSKMEDMGNTLTDMTNTLGKPTVDQKAKKGVAKMYKQAWLQDKLIQQNEKKKKTRGQKPAAKSSTGDLGADDKGGSKTTAKKTGKKREDQHDLEVVIEDLRNEQAWRDEEMLELRKEVNGLREANKILMSKNKKETCERQILEANKLKYTMMKELIETKGDIDNGTFFDKVKKGT